MFRLTPNGVVFDPAKSAVAVKVGVPPYLWEPETATSSGITVRPVARADVMGVPNPVAMSYPLLALNCALLAAL